ncbi:glutathionyl-hydroquinone reductase YqjG [Halomonas elongata]|uniref:Glutathionyl-hydroquinone reductase YqjG n=1 Tax=Halomonas elongata TaxID=2746 RepID=A0A1B8NUV4_HALEL|nr:glutathionyl-hydroquinone reductase YqjG [Halomonas elongata]
MRRLKGLTSLIDVSVTSPLMLDQGWSYHRDEGSSGDPLNDVEFHHQLYTLTDPRYTGRVTVPALWDKHEGRIVNNESAELVRMFNGAFDDLTGNRLDLYPRICARPSMPSTPRSTITSTTASTRRDSPPSSRSTRNTSARYSSRWTVSRRVLPSSATWPANG